MVKLNLGCWTLLTDADTRSAQAVADADELFVEIEKTRALWIHERRHKRHERRHKEGALPVRFVIVLTLLCIA